MAYKLQKVGDDFKLLKRGDSYVLYNDRASSSTDYSEVTLSNLSPSSFDTTYEIQSTGFVLDTGTVSSNSAQFHAYSNYYYYVAKSGSFNTGRILIWSVEDNSWVVLLAMGEDYTEGNVSDDEAISNLVGTATVTGSSETADGRNVPQASSNIVYATTSSGGGCGSSRSISSDTTIPYTPNYSFSMGTTYNTYETFSSGDDFYDEYGIEQLSVNNSFVTIYFTDSVAMSNFRSAGHSIWFDWTGSGTEPDELSGWDGVEKSVDSNAEYSINSSYYYVHYQFHTSTDRTDIAKTAAAAGSNSTVLNITIH